MSYAGIFDDEYGRNPNRPPAQSAPPSQGGGGSGDAPPTQSPAQGASTHHDLRFPYDPLNALMVQKLQRWMSQGGAQRAVAAQALAEVVPASGVLGALAAIAGTDLRRPGDPLNFEAVTLGVRAYARGKVSEQQLEATLSRKSAKSAIRYFARRL
jgi:hypothetical protein